MENEQQVVSLNTPLQQGENKKRLFSIAFNRIPKKFLLFFIAVLLLFLFFLLPANKKWYKEKVIGYWNDFRVQRKQLFFEQRKAKRFGGEYTYSKFITDLFEKKGIKNNVLVLVPSEAYFKRYGISYHVPEPVTFYYLTGLKTVWSGDSAARNANWFVSVHEKKLSIDSVINGIVLKDTIAAFKK
jgi:hypothetical protein